MRKVLIIAYYWPPAGGGGVQRWVKFAKYLAGFGWEPILYVPENADYPLLDPSLAEEIPATLRVIRRPIWEPYKLFRWFTGQKQKAVNPGFFSNPAKLSLAQKFAIWVRGNLFMPDARCFWIRPSVRFLNNFLQQEPVDAIISTGTPHSMHLIALGLKKKTGLPWLADFRDPWTAIEYHDRLMLSPWAASKHKRLEREVLKSADAVSTVSWNWAEDFRKMGAARVFTLTNGYDETDFATVPPARDDKFSLLHAGTLDGDRNIRPLWNILAKCCNGDDSFRQALSIRLLGPVHPDVLAEIDEAGLSGHVEHLAYVPHAEAIAAMRAAQLLMLIINESAGNAPGRIAGKVFEYLASGTALLCIGPPDGDAARVVRECGGGTICPPGSALELEQAILRHYDAYRAGKPLPGADPSAILRYSRQNLSQQLAGILDQISGQEQEK